MTLLDPDEVKSRSRNLVKSLSRIVGSRVSLELESKYGREFPVEYMLGSTAQEFAFTICIGKERYDTPVFANPYFATGKGSVDFKAWVGKFSDEIIKKHSYFIDTGKRYEDSDDTGSQRDRATEWYF